METPILSIVIPTKDRYSTLISIVKYFLSWDRADFEIVVQDNSLDNSVFEQELSTFRDDQRLKYSHITEPMPMIDNCSKAIERAKGDYVCFIGDDDGLIEATIDLCIWLKNKNYDSATFQRFSYDWPDLSKKLGESSLTDGILTSRNFEATLINVESKTELIRYLKYGATNLTYRGPFPYNGLVKRNIFEETFKNTGQYFPAPTPDVACMVSTALLAKKHAYIKLPYICGGQSLSSAAGLGRQGMHVGEIENIKSLPSDTKHKWSSELPPFWSGFTINAESAIKSLEAWKRDDLRGIFNFNRTLAAIIIYLQPEYRSRAWKHTKKMFELNYSNISKKGTILEIGKIQLFRTYNFIKRKFSNQSISYHPNIGLALDFIQEQMSQKYPNLAPKIRYSSTVFQIKD